MAAKEGNTLVVTEKHRIVCSDSVTARLLAGYINDTGRTTVDEGIGIYDYAELHTTYEAEVE